MYSGANFYGIREILLSYAKLPLFLPLPVAVQHGWQLSATSFDAAGNPPEIWVSSHRIAAEFSAFYPKKKIRVIGSFYCYLVELLKNDLSQVERYGSICIPPHSSHFASTEYSVEKFAQTLDDLGDEYKPITVMLYYLDMNSQIIDEYEKYGFKVVSNGSLFDKDFLKKFIHNVNDKQHCIFSDFGSGVIFSADLGLNLVHVDIKSHCVNRGNKHIKTDDKAFIKSALLHEEFFRKLDSNIIEQELGKSHLLSPYELRKVILRNYFTWSFITTFSRRMVGNILRSVGIFRKEKKLG